MFLLFPKQYLPMEPHQQNVKQQTQKHEKDKKTDVWEIAAI